MEEEDGEKELTDLQRDIEAQLERDTTRRRKTNPTSSPGAHLFGIGKFFFFKLVKYLIILKANL